MVDLRREFTLPPEDVSFLNEMGWAWEAIRDRNRMWLVIHQYRVPKGYQINSTSVALQLAATYPEAQIDMAYFYPILSRADGVGIRKLTNQQIDGKIWQRWSRHRTTQNPWQPGVDGVETHMLLVGEWLKRELQVAA